MQKCPHVLFLFAGTFSQGGLFKTGDKTVLAFSKNGSGLGVAFDISGYSGMEFRPAVSMDEAGQGVTISETATSNLAAFQLVPTPRQGVEETGRGGSS